MVERSQVWTILQAVLFSILLIIYYIGYMEPALDQYGKKSTTIAQRREEIDVFESPIFVACPDPPFKKSFFRKNGVNKSSGAEKYFWTLPLYQNILGETTSSAMDLFMNMTYRLGTDWQISIFYQLG